VGFLRPEKIGEDAWLFSAHDLHAWPEMYFSGSGWVRFEPTPAARTGNPPAWTTGVAPPAPTTPPSATTAPSARDTRDAQSRSASTAPDSTSQSGSNLAAWSVGLVLVLLLLALPRLVRTRQRRRRLDDHRTGPRIDDAHEFANGAWEELCATARDLGVALPLQRSVREIAHALRRRALPGSDAQRQLDELTGFVERARYGRPFTVDAATRQRVVAAVESWDGVLAASVPRAQARFARFFPRSVFERGSAAVVVDRQVELVGSDR
jgi:hypothetical protein